MLSYLDYGTSYIVQRLQSVISAATWLIYLSSRCKHVTPPLHQLHLFKATQLVDLKLAVLAYKCLHGLAAIHLADELQLAVNSEARHHL